MYQTYKDRAEFFIVYIKEAHPSNGWVMPENEQIGIAVKDPRSYRERTAVAAKACSVLNTKLPCLIDGLNNAVNKAYSAWPDRIFIVDTAGKIAVLGGQGPFGFEPSVLEARAWMENYFRVGSSN
jgi:hypothetical protein